MHAEEFLLCMSGQAASLCTTAGLLETYVIRSRLCHVVIQLTLTA